MAGVYQAMPVADQSRVLIGAIGTYSARASDSSFCKGQGPVSHDDSGGSLWEAWGANQRDVFFFRRSPNTTNWCFYCRFSMDSNQADFGPTFTRLLADTSPCSSEATAPNAVLVANAGRAVRPRGLAMAALGLATAASSSA
mmetsp:Transcript_71133/g.186536  ORF Transcript_71133/g.186536 Transcript_71133/m.186536 type:complete len:141 (-) Transcript_71133:100-522(-)